MGLKNCAFLLLISINCIFAEDVVINLPKGQIRGKVTTAPNVKSTFYSYQGIPYAHPPIGNLRYQPPVEPNTWEGVFDATKWSNICPQWQIKHAQASEDCLYLNVYTPIKPGQNASLPVHVFLHGGAFIIGDSRMYPYYHMDEEMVVVLPNFRVGAFGFLSTLDESIPGNYALKDQLFALKWVQENIHLFGGDPTKVVIGGQSSGSANSAALLMSPKSKGLFKGVILESGSVLNSWAYQVHSREYAYQVAKAIDPSFTDKNTTLELRALLMNATTDQINLADIEGPHGEQLGQGDDFSQVLEPEHEDAVLTELLHESLKNGNFNHVPVLMGLNSGERIFEADYINVFRKKMGMFDDNLPLIVNPDFNVKQEDLQAAGEALRKIYTGGDRFENHVGPSSVFKSDVRYSPAIFRHAFLQSNYTDVFAYVFSYHGKLGGNTYHVEGAEAVAHGDELYYTWYYTERLHEYPEADQLTQRRLMKLWTNFIKYLNPTPESDDLLQGITWPTVSQDNFRFLVINDTLSVDVNPKKYKEWMAVIEKYGNPPFNSL